MRPARLVHAAGNMFAPVGRRAAIVQKACQRGDIVTLSEVIAEHALLAGLGRWHTVVRGELAILARKDHFEVADQGSRRVMRGGRTGTGDPGDTRRRGPDRDVLWALLVDLEDRDELLVFTHHAIAKADTTYRWRRPLRRLGFIRVARVVRQVRRLHPDAAVVLTGDLNKVGRIVAFAAIGLHRVPAPPTFGPKRYDRIYRAGRTVVSSVRRFRTAGDHWALAATITTTTTGEGA